eukprot:GAFH01003138.1.p1 GENE.GAFH01003138.1~~GAFH01003138.1.p1  ORF type:complete len:257 (+),score=19.24 GAFH01003138.1:71-841(+)
MQGPFYDRINDDFQRFCAIASNAIYTGDKQQTIDAINRDCRSLAVPFHQRVVHMDWHPDGYAMFLLLRDPLTQDQVGLLVFCGTCSLWDNDPDITVQHRLNDLVGDLLLPFGMNSSASSSTLAWARHQIAQHSPAFTFFTGHSLGGFLAEAIALQFALENRQCAAVLFNAPGPHAFFHLFVRLFANGKDTVDSDLIRPVIIHHRVVGDPVSAIEQGVFSGTQFYEWTKTQKKPHPMPNFLPPSPADTDVCGCCAMC